MTPFQWVLLCIFFTLYLLFGGSVFMLIEQHHEIHQKEELHVLRQDIQEILFRLDHNFYSNSTSADVLDALTSAKEGVINRIASVCGLDNLLEDTDKPEPSGLRWNYYNSVFFAFTVVTTIGYGHLSPTTSMSKAFMIAYALFGIPINGILLSGVGDYFSNKLVRVHEKSKQKTYRGRCTLIFEIIFYLIPGMVVFIIIPAGIFVLIENWTFLDSVYFAFVSLTTIGFGDYVAGMGDGHNVWLWLYKAFIIIWITFGLGYLIMILGFIAKGLKSKQVRGVLEKRLSGIRTTKDKLSKDIDYMRKIVNELYLMKVKPTYDVNGAIQSEDDFQNGDRRKNTPCVHFERRCSSLPKLPTEDEEPTKGGKLPSPGRGLRKLIRRVSESDLPQATEGFSEASGSSRHTITNEELLASVVNALSSNMMEVINAVDELNEYEEATQRGSDSESDEKDFDDHLGPHWDLGALSESDEEVLLEDDDPVGKLESVVVHKTDDTDSGAHSFIEKVTGAIRKISGTKTPPLETPSRKTSRNESEANRKISRAGSEQMSPAPRLHVQHSPHHFHQHHHAPFGRRGSSLRRKSSIHETDPKRHFRRGSTDHNMRKISQESHISNVSTGSYRTIEEIMSSARASRRATPTKNLNPLCAADQVDASNGRICPETNSLVHLLKALDHVQERLKKSSGQSEISQSGSYRSDYSTSADLSNSFAPSSATKPISFRRSIRELSPPDNSSRTRKVGVFQPGFSYDNHGFHAGDEGGLGGAAADTRSSRRKKEENGVPRSRKFSRDNNSDSNHSGR